MGRKCFRCKMINRKTICSNQTHASLGQQVGGIFGKSRPSIKEFCGACGVLIIWDHPK